MCFLLFLLSEEKTLTIVTSFQLLICLQNLLFPSITTSFIFKLNIRCAHASFFS